MFLSIEVLHLINEKGMLELECFTTSGNNGSQHWASEGTERNMKTIYYVFANGRPHLPLIK